MAKKIAYDVDGVLANFAQALIDKAIELNLGEFFPVSWLEIDRWFFSEKIPDVWSVIENDPSFWLNIKPIEGARESIRIIPDVYITARPVSSIVTSEWLWKNGFPYAPVYTVEATASKQDILLFSDIGLLVDDKLENCLDAREIGIDALLYSQPHNRNIVYPNRIKSLEELLPLIMRGNE